MFTSYLIWCGLAYKTFERYFLKTNKIYKEMTLHFGFILTSVFNWLSFRNVFYRNGLSSILVYKLPNYPVSYVYLFRISRLIACRAKFFYFWIKRKNKTTEIRNTYRFFFYNNNMCTFHTGLYAEQRVC